MGTVVGTIVVAFLVTLVHAMVVTAASRHDLMLARTQTEQLLERMRSEAESAWSISVPPTDVTGASNADGHEVDFATEDATRNLYRWAYRYDPAAQTITRYAAATGASPQPGVSIPGVSAFSARIYPVNAVADPSSPIYDPLFAGDSVTPVSFPLPGGSAGGNAFVFVVVAAAGTSVRELLSTGVAPTQFTVVVKYTPPP